MGEILVARQPIFDARLEVVGYELLFRGAVDAEHAVVLDADAATSRVLLNTFFELGAERVVGSRLAFVNLSRGFILGELPQVLDPAKVVLEVLEDVEPEPAVLAAIDALRERGFQIALDDYSGREEHEPFLDHVDLVKVDCQVLGLERMGALVGRLRGRGVRLLAEKVETRGALERYRELGFELFQGFFLMRPEIVRGRGIPARRLALLRLLARLHDPAVELDDVEGLVSQDVTLAFRLLRHVNSAAYGFQRRIAALREALVALGLDRTRAIVSLLAISSIDDKPSELVQYALIRGRMCELIARRVDPTRSSVHFTTGLLSVLDAVTDTPMEQVVAQLPLADDVTAALLGRAGGQLGEVLEVVRAYERGDWAGAFLEGVGAAELLEDYYQAISFARELEAELVSAV